MIYVEVRAIGPFRRELVPFLTHAPERYADTREGAALFEIVLLAYGSTNSRAVARCMGRTEKQVYTQEAFDPWRADIEALREITTDERVEAFLAFRQAGFTFFYYADY